MLNTEIMMQEAPSQVDMNQLMQVVQGTAMNVNSNAKQLGFVTEKIGDHDRQFELVWSEIGGLKQSVTLTRAQIKQMYNAVGNRVTHLLREAKISGSKFTHYYGRFKSQLWRDAKKHSRMDQDYKLTLKADFEIVMGYIASWYPEGYDGVSGYIEHLDSLHCDG